MADNFLTNPGSGGTTFASDDIGGVHTPRVKVTLGGDGTNDGDLASGNPMPVQLAAYAAGGASIYRSLDLDETEEEVKSAQATLFAIWFSNTATATRFLKIYNATASTVTVGTTTPVITIAMPGNSSDDVSGSLLGGPFGIAFSTALTIAATTGAADNDTGAPATGDCIVNVFYK